MKKITSLMMMALLTIGIGLVSCGEFDNAVGPVVDEKVEVSSIEFDLSKIDAKYVDSERTKLVLTVGDEVTLSFIILPVVAADTEVELTADDASILSIDGLKVTVLKEGETKLTAKAGDKTATCTVVVRVNLSAATAGMFVGADGFAYASADEASTAGTTAEAYIAYKSATAGESRAIALTNDAAFGTSWDAFNSNPGWGSAPNRTPIDNCIWQWPTKADFENMLGHLVTLSTDNGVLEDGCVYLSSTTHETNNARFWNLFFKPSNSEIRLGHNYKNGGDPNRTVRAVLAF